jgi:hypothetical protein
MYDVATSRFTIPSAGQYNLNLVLCWSSEQDPIQWQYLGGMQIYRNGTPLVFVNKIAAVPDMLASQIVFSGSSSITMHFEQGDEVQPVSAIFNINGIGNFANIFLIGTFAATPPSVLSPARVSVASVHKV